MDKTKNLKDKINENLRKVVRWKAEEEKIVEKPAKDEDANSKIEAIFNKPVKDWTEEEWKLAFPTVYSQKEAIFNKPVKDWTEEEWKLVFLMFRMIQPPNPMLSNSKELEKEKKYYQIAKKIVEKPEGDEIVEKPEGNTIRKGIYAIRNKIKSFLRSEGPEDLK